MARYNKIFAGPASEAKPQAREGLAIAATKPGRLVTLSSSGFALATAATVGKVYVAQENYLAMKGPDTDWAIGSTVVALELLDEQLFNVRIATGNNVTIDAALTPAANGELALAGDEDLIVAHANEAYNNTSGSGQLVQVRPAKGYLTPAGT